MSTSNHQPKAVYAIIEGAGRDGRDIFRRVGSAFVNKDDSLKVFLDAAPLSGKLWVREPFERKRGEAA